MIDWPIIIAQLDLQSTPDSLFKFYVLRLKKGCELPAAALVSALLSASMSSMFLNSFVPAWVNFFEETEDLREPLADTDLYPLER